MGRDHARTMLGAAERQALALEAGCRVLDFGCGAGRMTRALAAHAQTVEIWGVDIDGAAIDWCRRNLSPPFRFAQLAPVPHLPFDDHTFDLIYAGAVFTQIDEQVDAWLLELRRVLRPGGVLHLSINDNHVLDTILDSPPGHWLHDTELRRRLVAFDEEHRLRVQGFTRFGVDVGGVRPEVFHDLDALRANWARLFEIREVMPNAHAYQTGLTLVRPQVDEIAPAQTFDQFVESARGYTRCDVATRARLQESGINVEISHFYSCIPTVSEIEGSFEYQGDACPYGDDTLFPPERLLAVLRSLEEYAHEFNPPRLGDPLTADRFFWDNGMFSCSDAMAYYCMIRLLKPRRIVEVGCGHSTLIALEALERNGRGSIVCIEPHPPRFFERIASRLERLIVQPVQAVALDFFNEELSSGDILFIDSTHTVKAGSDCLWLYLKILPYLRPAVMIHAHDIFLPRGYPQSWLLDHRYFWTEQYLLHALLLGNPRYEVCFGSAYHLERNRSVLTQFMRGQAAPGGSSFWFRALGQSDARSVSTLHSQVP